ncbi:hypothetical protein BGZ51_006040 [Haplosporangium sp. Z 767]|nr:hypothetical protein BGZ51_006040 [Haplosporangium sp. Z 767]
MDSNCPQRQTLIQFARLRLPGLYIRSLTYRGFIRPMYLKLVSSVTFTLFRLLSLSFTDGQRHFKNSPWQEIVWIMTKHRNTLLQLTIEGFRWAPPKVFWALLSNQQRQQESNMNLDIGFEAIGLESGGLVALRHLTFRIPCLLDPFAWAQLLDTCQGLESLSLADVLLDIDLIRELREQYSGRMFTSPLQQLQFTRLRRLQLTRLPDLDSIVWLRVLISQCPALQSLSWTIKQGRGFPGKEFCRFAVSGAWPHLSELEVQGKEVKIEDHHLATILGMRANSTLDAIVNSSWSISSSQSRPGRPFQRLHLRGSKFGSQATMALLSPAGKHTAVLRELDLSKCDQVTSGMVSDILTSCARLQFFAANRIEMPELINGKPWVCTGLKNLVLFFDVGEPGGGILAGSANAVPNSENRERRKLVYSRLATLLRLETLDLSLRCSIRLLSQLVDMNGMGLAPLTLRLELSEGLDLLSTLTRLRRVVIPDNVKCCEAEDMQWMVNNWPALEYLDIGWGGCLSPEKRMSARDKVVKIPELVAAISQYLIPSNLYHCVCVCNLWNQAFIPELWFNIDDDNWLQLLYFRDLSRCIPTPTSNAKDSWAWNVFNKYGHHIRYLTIHWTITAKVIADIITRPRLEGQEEPFSELLRLDFRFDTMNRQEEVIWERRRTLYMKRCDMKSEQRKAERLRLICNKPRPPPEEMISEVNCMPEPPGFRLALDKRRIPGTEFALEDGYKFWGDWEARSLDLERTMSAWQIVFQNIASNRLRRLSFCFQTLWTLDTGIVRGVVANFGALTHLELTLNPGEDLWLLVGVAPRLESLVVKEIPAFEYEAEEGYAFAITSKSEEVAGIEKAAQDGVVFEALRSLTIPYKIVRADFPHFMKIFPALEYLYFNGCRDPREELAAGGLDPAEWDDELAMVNIRSLVVTPVDHGHYPLRDMVVANDFDNVTQLLHSIVIWLPHLVSLNVPSLEINTALALALHCPTLEKVTVGHPNELPNITAEDGVLNGVVNKLLTSCPNLKSFDGVRYQLEVLEVMSTNLPWICRGLETLRCQIVGVNRLTVANEMLYKRVIARGFASEHTIPELTVLVQAMTIKHEHCDIYRRLAALTQLKCLDLGYEYRDVLAFENGAESYISERDGREYLRFNPPFDDTLMLSLETGLDILGALTELEVFGFEGVDHRIGKNELDWMSKAWPKLKVIHGLHVDRGIRGLEYDYDKAELREYFQTLRPDVKHDSLLNHYGLPSRCFEGQSQ